MAIFGIGRQKPHHYLEAMKSAQARDADLQKGIISGPLHGVPVTVKESFNVKGLKTTVNPW